MADEGPRAPARGALDGIKKDLERAKKDGGSYDPRGFGQAWTHNFLNQKPWHPMNFRNQIRRFDAEVEHQARLKREKVAKEEFAREQEHMQQMSMLGDKQREAYEARASLSFMYSKPPGLDAALAREQEEADGGEAKRPGPDISKLGVPLGAPQVAERGPMGGGSGDATRDEEQRRLQQHAFHDPVVSSQYVTAHGDTRWELKAEREAARHAGHGGLDASHANQQLVVADEEELAAEAEEALLSHLAPEDRARILKAKRKLKKEQQLAEAEEVLRRAGYDVGDIASGHKKKRRREEEREAGGKAGIKKAKKEKKEKKSKHKSSGREPMS